MARMSSSTPDPPSSSDVPEKMGDGAVVGRSPSNFVCKLAATAAVPPAVGSVLREMQRRHKLAAAAATSSAAASSSTAAEIASGARVGALTVLVKTENRSRGVGVEDGRNVVGANEPNVDEVSRGDESVAEESARLIDGDNESKSSLAQVCSSCPAAVAIFVADPSEDMAELSVSSKTMRTDHRREILSETYDMSDDDDEIFHPVEAGSTTATAVLSAAAAARARSRKTCEGTTDTATAITKRCRRIIAASAVLIFVLGFGLAQTRRKGNGGDNQSVFGSTGGISSMVPSVIPSIVPSTKPSVPPSDVPSSSSSPTINPSDSPSLFPTTTPSSTPTDVLSSNPSTSHAPTSFIPGDLAIMNTDLDIRMSSGLSVKAIARTGQFIDYGYGSSLSQRFHGMMDGAGIVPLLDGGYVYVSNSEIER